MKKKLILALTTCLFAAGSIINMHLAQNDQNTDISLADISVMAQAGGEHDPCPGGEIPVCKWIDDDFREIILLLITNLSIYPKQIVIYHNLIGIFFQKLIS